LEPSDRSPTFTMSYTLMAKGFGWPQWGMGIQGLNSRLLGWLIERLVDDKRVTGVIPMDFYRETGDGGADGVREILVMLNAR
jgi:1-phosphatidylinositol phosphodiesterase